MVKLPFKLLLMSYLFPAYMWPIYAHLWGRQNFYFHCHDLSLRRCYNHLSTRQGTGSWSRCVTCVDIAAHHRAVQLLTVSSLSSSNVAPPLYVVPPSVFLALVLIRCFFFFCVTFLLHSWVQLAHGGNCKSQPVQKRRERVYSRTRREKPLLNLLKLSF